MYHNFPPLWSICHISFYAKLNNFLSLLYTSNILPIFAIPKSHLFLAFYANIPNSSFSTEESCALVHTFLFQHPFSLGPNNSPRNILFQQLAHQLRQRQVCFWLRLPFRNPRPQHDRLRQRILEHHPRPSLCRCLSLHLCSHFTPRWPD